MQAKKKKVLVVHNYYQIPGGEDSVVTNEVKLLQDHGHEVILYTRSNLEIDEMKRYVKIFLPVISIFNIKTYWDIRRIINKEKIDIVHVHNTVHLISPSVYYAAISLNVPVVQTIHNFRLLCPGATFYRNERICENCLEYGLKCAVRYNCYRSSKLQTLACVLNIKLHRKTGIYGKLNYICLTNFNKEKLCQIKQINKDMVFVKPHFVEDCNDIVPASKRFNRIVFAGRLDRLKGIDLLLKAWKQMGITAPELIICGIGPMEKWCKKFVKENGLINVKMLGFVKNSDVRKILKNSKALILPTQWYEGFPMSIIEAFSVGTPVLCSEIGNCGCIVDNGITGYKFNPSSTENIIKAIKKINNQLYECTYSQYKLYYTEEKNLKMLEDIYDLAGHL